MKKKISIIGGIGYIGTELSLLYSGFSRTYDVTVIDNRFISERVTQLRKWGIRFVQGDILDKEMLKKEISDSDIIYHLAGITDVAYVKSDDSHNDNLIKDVAIEGTENIIKFSKQKVKIIFPSSHVVYEGFKKQKKLITEDSDVKPELTYSKCKYQSELDLKNSEKNFVILRLASVHGYSTDTMRTNIMPNLFSKITSQKKTIKLFGGGEQLKCLVGIKDVARAFMFCGENEKISNQIFHVCNENYTVKRVAELCKEISPDLNIETTNDEVPNLGYSLDGSKLTAEGFEYRYDLKNSLNEMISNWSVINARKDLEYTYRGGDDYIDDRGVISNYELTEPINLIGYIESVKGSVRANHYHPVQEQKCLLIKGKYVSVIKDLIDKNSIVETQIINAGDLSVIKPNVAHTMVFLEDSIFLNLVRGEREHKNYGISHTIPFNLVDNNFKEQILESYVLNCRVCGSENLEILLSLGKSPLANNLLEKPEDDFESFPLEVCYCKECFNAQLSFNVDPKKMFSNYLYKSSTAEDLVNHFNKASKEYIKDFKLNENSFVVDIGSNDGIGLKYFIKKNIKVLGVEPAKNLSNLSNDSGIKTINAYFNNDSVNKILDENGHADLVLASNVFAHSNDLKTIGENAMRLLNPQGVFILEVQYFIENLKRGDFDNVYHEHFNYWTVSSLNVFFKKLGFPISKVELINTHGGSIRVYVSKAKKIFDSSAQNFLLQEAEFGINDIKTIKKYGLNFIAKKDNVHKNLIEFKNKGLKIIGYGAPAKATTLLNFLNIDSKILECVIEDNPLKIDKFIPGTGIQIVSKEKLNYIPDIVIVLAWNYFDSIKSNNRDFQEKGSKFISIKELFKSNNT